MAAVEKVHFKSQLMRWTQPDKIARASAGKPVDFYILSTLSRNVSQTTTALMPTNPSTKAFREPTTTASVDIDNARNLAQTPAVAAAIAAYLMVDGLLASPLEKRIRGNSRPLSRAR